MLSDPCGGYRGRGNLVTYGRNQRITILGSRIPMNISMLLTKTVRLYPDKLALVEGEKKLSYSQFNTRCNKLANTLLSLGLTKGEHVAILQHNRSETLESLFACFKAGLGAVPINFRLHPNEFIYIIDHSQSKVVIVSPEFNESILNVRDRLSGVRHILSLSGTRGELLDYERALENSSEGFIDADVEPDDLAWLFYTSGTTGEPKGACLTHRNLLAMTMNFYADICPGFAPSDVILHAAPISHGSGLYALPNIGKGATNVILDRKSFDAERVFQTIENHKVTNMFVAPTMIKMMLDHPAVDHYDLSSLRSLIYGGAPILVEDLKKAMTKLGHCLSQLYGQGESPMTITYLPHCDHILGGDQAVASRLASAGFARTDVDLKIFDENDNELPLGEIGEIVTRSDAVMKGYWRNPKATNETLRKGWLHTGDIGYLDDRGYLFIMDRSKDMIISGGENIYPREIEEVLIRHPAVREVAVVGVPDEKWGEAIKAVVSLYSGFKATEEELIAFCKKNIASYKKPKSIDFVAELPKNNYGKILKREIREGYWKGRARRV
jgi:acyl-CoA synthetase (AMP-forming)/AMP-acid ligase II